MTSLRDVKNFKVLKDCCCCCSSSPLGILKRLVDDERVSWIGNVFQRFIYMRTQCGKSNPLESAHHYHHQQRELPCKNLWWTFIFSTIASEAPVPLGLLVRDVDFCNSKFKRRRLICKSNGPQPPRTYVVPLMMRKKKHCWESEWFRTQLTG